MTGVLRTTAALTTTVALATYYSRKARKVADPDRIRRDMERFAKLVIDDKGRTLGDIPAEALHPDDIRAYIRRRRTAIVTTELLRGRKKVRVDLRPVTDATIGRELRTLRAALHFCIKEQVIARACHVEMPEGWKGKHRTRVIDEAETGDVTPTA